MLRLLITVVLVTAPALFAPCQKPALDFFISDSSMINASAGVCVINTVSMETVIEHNSLKSLTPASILKLITSASALETLGPGFTFRTTLGYTGTLDPVTGILTGDLVIKGGGDPALGSDYFYDHYGNFIDKWVDIVTGRGIKTIEGKIIADDSRYDYQPVPARWQWEDTGNYYGAGAFGLSVFDNTCRVHLISSDSGSVPLIHYIKPPQYSYTFTNRLVSEGSSDRGYIFSAPYSTSGWISGTIPVNNDDFVLKGSIADPPLLLARILDHRLDSAGIVIRNKPSTTRLEGSGNEALLTPVAELISPPLEKIIDILNRESVNLYAEHLIKEMGIARFNEGTTAAGIKAVEEFLEKAGIPLSGMFIEDGSGLSKVNGINPEGMSRLLYYMKKESRFSDRFISSLPVAGKEGTLKNYFTDPVFDMRMRAKSGSMQRVRCYAGYLTTMAGNELAFCIMVNNYSGNPLRIIKAIEQFLKELMLYG